MYKFHQVCIIDDDPVYVYCTRKLFDTMDVAKDFMVFNNGQEALRFFSNKLNAGEVNIPEVIFLDINMPVMNGWQFMENFTQLPNHHKIKVFMVSSSMDPYDKCMVDDYQHVEYIVKPITKVQVLNMLEDLV